MNWILLSLTLVQVTALAADAPSAHTSFKNELQHSINRGTAWLMANQQSNGCWSTPEAPAVTALALSALYGDPSQRHIKSPQARLGFQFILKAVKPDGSIHTGQLPNYNTAISLMALLARNNSEDRKVILNARQWLVDHQIDLGEKGKLDTQFDGGIGYGSKYEHSDMNNTLTALEALYHSKRLLADSAPASKDLDWQAAIQFLQNCQNLPEKNKQDWVSNKKEDHGGFVYYPGHSMAGGTTNQGKVSLRSYGSVSYAGLLSYIYADLKKTDPRVIAVFDWLRSNYTLQENPGMGQQGLYYYIHLMSKALAAYGVDELELADGRKLDWRREVAMKLLDLQRQDGSWWNDTARWWEKDPALVTSYALLTLELIHHKL